jgi:hypothetical protein
MSDDKRRPGEARNEGTIADVAKWLKSGTVASMFGSESWSVVLRFDVEPKLEIARSPGDGCATHATAGCARSGGAFSCSSG